MSEQVDHVVVDAATTELETFERAFKADARPGNDRLCASYVPIILDKLLNLKRLLGEYHSLTDEDGDGYWAHRGNKAIELLGYIPETPKPGIGQDPPKSGGFPLTRTALWKPIIHASVRGCKGDEVFARAILKKIRLTGEEAQCLKICLTENLDRKIALFEPRLLQVLMRANTRSEAIVVRAYMHAAASRMDDERLLRFWADAFWSA